jgi:GDP-D-mannose dehydratase
MPTRLGGFVCRSDALDAATARSWRLPRRHHKTHSVREFAELAFKKIGVDIEWFGQGVDDVRKDASSGLILVRTDRMFFRPAEVDYLVDYYAN